MRLSLFCLSGLWALHVLGAAPTVSVTSVTQDPATRAVTVTYALSDGPAVITADFFAAGETAARRPVRSLRGDVNRKVSGATGTFTWYPDADWGDAATDCALTAKVTAWPLDGLPNYMVVDLTLKEVRFYRSPENFPWDGGLTSLPCKTDKLVMRKIPAAGVTWTMGTGIDAGRFADEVPHQVTLTKDYYIGVYPVTQRQCLLIKGANPSSYSTYPEANVCPAQCLSYEDLRGTAIEDTTFLGKLRALVSQAVDFDLPTEAQWEYACRAGCGQAFNNGATTLNVNLDEVAWWSGNCTNEYDGVMMPRPVGLKLPNHWGLYDMHGNVSEHCRDWYGENPNTPLAANAAVTDPTGPASGTTVVLRGGSWNQNMAKFFRSAYRNNSVATSRRSHLEGVRVACPAVIK